MYHSIPPDEMPESARYHTMSFNKLFMAILKTEKNILSTLHSSKYFQRYSEKQPLSLFIPSMIFSIEVAKEILIYSSAPKAFPGTTEIFACSRR